MKPQGSTMRTEERQRQPPAKTMTKAATKAATTSDQILGEIRDYCRKTRTAESTFGRLVVNDGKLVSRLRDGAKITTGTLDKVRASLPEYHSEPAANAAALPARSNGAAAEATSPAEVQPAGFR